MRDSRQAFTLIEVLIVLVIVGIATTMAGSGFNLMMRMMDAKTAAYRFRDAIQLARSDAMARARYGGIALDTSSKRWTRFVDNQSAGTVGMLDPMDTLIGVDSLTGFAVNSISCTRMAGSVCAVVFSPDGSTLDAGSLHLVLQGTKSSVVFSVLIVAATGFTIAQVQ